MTEFIYRKKKVDYIVGKPLIPFHDDTDAILIHFYIKQADPVNFVPPKNQ